MRLLPALLLTLTLAGCGDVVVGEAGSGAATPTVTVDRAPAGCPDAFPAPDDRGATPWVPAPPTAETPGRLVPDADPVGAVVCRYTPPGFDDPDQDRPAPLEASVALTSGLERIRADLLLPEKVRGQDRACTLIGSALVPHLLRLDYADGSVWVSSVQDANSCQDSGNGDFTTGAYLGGRLAQAYDTRAWPAPPPVQDCFAGGGGRSGQERQLVPDGWTGLLFCRGALDEPPPPAEQVEDATAREVADALNDADTRPGSGGCSGPATAHRSLLFTYPQGPPVTVRLSPGCDPPLANGSLDAVLPESQVAAVEDLLLGP